MQKFTFLVAACAAALAGCKSGGSDPAPSPSYTGQVQLVDEFGARQANGSGATVTVTDATPQLTAQTAADGTFSFTGVPSGPHTLSYAKPGFGTYQLFAATAVANQTTALSPVVLSPVSSTVIGFNPVQQLGPKYIISGYVSPLPTAAQPRPHRLYLQRNDANVAVPQPIGVYYNLSVAGRTRPDGTFSDTVSLAQLTAAGIGKYYTKILVWGTGDNPAASTYTDATAGTVVYPAAVPVLTRFSQFYVYP